MFTSAYPIASITALRLPVWLRTYVRSRVVHTTSAKCSGNPAACDWNDDRDNSEDDDEDEQQRDHDDRQQQQYQREQQHNAQCARLHIRPARGR